MSKRKVIVIGSILAVVIFLVLSFIFMPTISLTPSEKGQEMYEKHNVMMNTGIFFFSDEALKDLMITPKENGDSEFAEAYERISQLQKRGRGAFVSNTVLFELINFNDEAAWKDASQYVWTFEQARGLVFTQGEIMLVSERNPLPKGYKAY